LDYWAPKFTSNIPGDSESSFVDAATWVKVVAVLILIAICWALQKGIQDILVAKLYGMFLTHRMKRINGVTPTPQI
jgi:hypothetical protein